MTRRLGLLMVLVGVVGVGAGCSSSVTSQLPDAAPGQTGTGGGDGGAGGGGGTGGGPGACVTFAGAVGAACAGVSNHAPCITEPPCFNTCGPLKSGVKNCTCAGGMWNCPTCEYDPDPTKIYSCYRRPATPTLCPADPTDPSGMMLIQSGATCVRELCAPCGSETSNAYRDGSGIAKIGFCVCSSDDPAAPGKWSCASTKEWPPACLTDR